MMDDEDYIEEDSLDEFGGRTATKIAGKRTLGGAAVRKARAHASGTTVKGIKAKDAEHRAGKLKAKADKSKVIGVKQIKKVRSSMATRKATKLRGAREKQRSKAIAKGKKGANSRVIRGESFEQLRDLVRSAFSSNRTEIKDRLSNIMADRVTDHLQTKKIEVARDFIGTPPEEGRLDNE
jgi:hypothetical protein